jgi:hypothetical protein
MTEIAAALPSTHTPRRATGRVRALLLLGQKLFDPVDGRSHAGFGAWCSAHPGRGCVLWLDSSSLTDLVCEAGAPLRAPAARTAWARRVLQHYHGDAAAGWAMLPWRWRAAWGVSALRGRALETLQAQATAHGVQLRAVRPMWPVLLERLLAQRPGLRRAGAAQAWLVEADDGQALLTRILLASGQVQAVNRRRLGTPLARQLESLLQEEPRLADDAVALLWLGAAPAEPLPLTPALSLAAPYAGVLPGVGTGPDFLQPQSRPGRLAWAWLATALVVLAVTAWDARLAWLEREQAELVVMPVPPVLRSAAQPAALDTEREALLQRLRHPWQAVFLASEAPAAAGLRWLALEHQAGGELRLQGVAADPAPVQQVAAHLRRQPPWQQVLVSRLEVVEGQADSHAFEIVARLPGHAP